MPPNRNIRVCGKFKCESFGACEKCAQNNLGEISGRKQQILTIFGGVVAIATADNSKLKLRVCGKFKCESVEACEKCAQNI